MRSQQNEHIRPEIANDLIDCNREPIQIPGSIQPHGILLALSEPDLKVFQASANIDIKNGTLESIFGKGAEGLKTDLQRLDIGQTPFLLRPVMLDGKSCNAIAHRHAGVLILEIETNASAPVHSFYELCPVLNNFVSQLEKSTGTIEDLCNIAAKEVRRLSGYGRALVYRFDQDWHGEVVAEDLHDKRMPSLMGHHFPGSDIPAQARELYQLNRIRIIPDANYKPVPLSPLLNPDTGKPLDLSFATLRSVSPIHVEYLKNMQTFSSMSVSIIVGGKLWGLIACHHPDPLYVPFDVRVVCEFIGQFLAPHIAAAETKVDFQKKIQLKAINSKLLAYMAANVNYTESLIEHQNDLLALVDASGVAFILPDQIILLGLTPNTEDIAEIVTHITQQGQEIYATTSLAKILPQAERYKEFASGILSLEISKIHNSYIIWFRQEVIETIKWSGDPRKLVSADGRIHPRKSFETWREIVTLTSKPWLPGELEAAAEFRNSVVGIVLKRAEELASLSEELETTNKELEAFSYTVSHDLRAPFRHIVGYSELLKDNEYKVVSAKGRHYIDSIIEAGQFAGQLVDNLLNFSKMGRLPLDVARVDLNKIAEEARAETLSAENFKDREIQWNIDPLPVVYGDNILLKLVFINLFANALKYSRHQKATKITCKSIKNDHEHIVSVTDNGVGFDMKYADKLFGVFQRLHKMEDFEGTGIGLANVKRIITRHNGNVWAVGKEGEGATFSFSLPHNKE